MLSTFHGIEVGKKGLQSSNTALQTIGHNLSNLETKGYSRQKVDQISFVPLFEPSANHPHQAGQIGSGSIIDQIERVRDVAIDDRIMYEKGGLGFWNMKSDFLHQVEVILDEPDTPSIRTVLDDYWESWQTVANNPTERAARDELVQKTKTVTDTFNSMYGSFYNLQQKADDLVKARITEVNNLASQIAHLNAQISQSEGVGDLPNDMYDKRDLLLDRLSEIVDIRLERGNKNELIVFIGSDKLVQGDLASKITPDFVAENNGYADVRWSNTGALVKLGSGELAGLISARDEDLFTVLGNMNSMAANLLETTNEIHKEGFGLNSATGNNFFKESRLSFDALGNYDFNNDGQLDGTALFKISGNEKVDVKTRIGVDGQLTFAANEIGDAPIVINYYNTDTIGSVIKRINESDAEVSAYLDKQGRFSLKANRPASRENPDFVIRHLEDSGNFLTGITGILNNNGADGAFDYQTVNGINQFQVPIERIGFTQKEHLAGWLTLDESILANSDNIAAASGIDTTGNGTIDQINGLQDNRNALNIASMKFDPLMVEKEQTMDDFFRGVVGEMGSRSEHAQINIAKNEGVVHSLENLRSQVSGVNIDEEMTNMMMFQHAYNASARLVTTMDRMIETIMQMGA